LTPFSFDAWGKKAILDETMMIDTLQVIGTPLSLIQVLDITPRGFTGHEHIDHADIIHMNGRIYDPVLGRFMQADPFIQSPKNSQNYNRYSYVINNPLSLTDPSGFNFLRKVVGFITNGIIGELLARKFPIVRTLLQAAHCLYGNAIGCAASSFGNTIAAGGSLKSAFTNAAFAYASAKVFTKIGAEFDGVGFMAKNGAGHIATHAVTGGVISTLRGGKFGHGFWSAGITKGLTPHFEGIGGADFEVNGYNVAEATIAGVLGGTISKVSGGKFANGAATAAMGNLFNNQGGGKKGTRSNPHGERLTFYTRHEVSKGVFAWIPQSVVADSYLANEVGTTIGDYTRTTEEDLVTGLSVVAGVATLGSGYVFAAGVITLGGYSRV
jgi:RHS repeat-associated protein